MAKKKTDTQAGTSPAPKRRIEATQAPNMPILYCNSANVDLSNWDIKIRLGQVMAGSPELVTIQEVCWVYMSHSHAKAFAAALNGILAKVDDVTIPKDGDKTKTTH